MSKTTKVKMLDTVEDSNVFRPDELEGLAPHEFVIKQTPRTEGNLVLAISRVDKLPQDLVIELPTSQAENLIKLGYAELAA